MDPNRETAGPEQARAPGVGEPGGPPNTTTGAPPQGYVPPYGGAAQPTQPAGYVPPELQPTGQSYAPPPSTGGGEPTRRWSDAPPQYAQPVAPAPQPAVEQHHGAPIFGPLLLIGAGVVLLLNSLNILDWSIWLQIWQLWPLLLVAAGLSLLLGRRSPALSALIVLLVLAAGAIFLYAGGGLRPLGPVQGLDLNVPLDGAKSAQVEVRSGIGNLNLDGRETSLLASGRLEYFESRGEPRHDLSRSGDTANLVLDWPDRGPNFGPIGPGPDWDVHLNSQVPLRLVIDAGVGETNLDLRQLKVTDLALHAGVGSVNVQLPEGAGTTTARIDGGVGDLDITIPDNVEARITVDSGIGGTDVDERFEEQGDHVYQSAGYASAKNKLDLDVHVGVGGVDIRSR